MLEAIGILTGLFITAFILSILVIGILEVVRVMIFWISYWKWKWTSK